MNRLREVRNEQRKTLRDVEKDLGYTISSISRWETGDNECKADVIQKFSDYYNVSVPYLLGISNIRNDAEIQSNIDGLQGTKLEAFKQLDKLDDEELKQALSYLTYLNNKKTTSN